MPDTRSFCENKRYIKQYQFDNHLQFLTLVGARTAMSQPGRANRTQSYMAIDDTPECVGIRLHWGQTKSRVYQGMPIHAYLIVRKIEIKLGCDIDDAHAQREGFPDLEIYRRWWDVSHRATTYFAGKNSTPYFFRMDNVPVETAVFEVEKITKEGMEFIANMRNELLFYEYDDKVAPMPFLKDLQGKVLECSHKRNFLKPKKGGK